MVDRLKIAIVGAGGVGGYIGAKLTQNGCDVTLIARGKHFETIKEKGLKVIEDDNEFEVKPKIVQEPKDAIFDVVFLTVKSYDFKSACENIESSIDENTIIISLANGVDHKSQLKKYLKKGILCDGTIYIISNIKSLGVIKRKSNTFYLIFGSEKKDERFNLLKNILNDSGLRSKYSENILYDCWKKYLFISSFASLTSYFNEPMGYIVNDQIDMLKDTLNEIKLVANAMDIPISDEDMQKCIKQAQNVPYDSKTSMQLDFEKGSMTELESLCGYIVNQGRVFHIDVKNMKKVYEKLK